MKKYMSIGVLSLISSTGAYFFTPSSALAGVAASVPSPFVYNFTVPGSLVEASDDSVSTSPYWWVNSGGRMYLEAGKGETIQGMLPSTDTWRRMYAASNPVDTDNGYHPQNIFRLLGRSLWKDFRQEAYFTIAKDNLSPSPNRNASNGILLFNRYKNGNNFYYTGLRVDGYAVIKKKLNGTYSTLGYVRIFPGTYNTSSNPNLLPKNTEVGLRSEVITTNGRVSIKLYSDVGRTGVWKLVAQAIDDGVKYGPIIDSAGYGGIRTDFMDVAFDHYRIENI